MALNSVLGGARRMVCRSDEAISSLFANAVALDKIAIRLRRIAMDKAFIYYLN
jgi:hypothetical protein